MVNVGEKTANGIWQSPEQRESSSRLNMASRLDLTLEKQERRAKGGTQKEGELRKAKRGEGGRQRETDGVHSQNSRVIRRLNSWEKGSL